MMVHGTCKKTHFVLYGFKKGELPADEATGTGHPADAPSPVVIRVMSELRNLGVALVAEHVFRAVGQDSGTSAIRRSIILLRMRDRSPPRMGAAAVRCPGLW